MTRPDNPSIDFAYFPHERDAAPVRNEIIRIPILPFNSTVPQRSNEALESVIRPEITTVSANGTHIESPSPISEVTENHTVDIDPFHLTSTVFAAASTVTGTVERLKEPGVVQEFWNGLLDDVRPFLGHAFSKGVISWDEKHAFNCQASTLA